MNYKLNFKNGNIQYVTFETMVSWAHQHKNLIESIFFIDPARNGFATKLL